MENGIDQGKQVPFFPYFLIMVFAGLFRFLKIMDPFTFPGYSGSIGNNGTDEGIFLMAAKLVSSGYQMYVDVNTQQGPLFSYIFSILEGDPFNIRIITAIISLIGIVGLILICERSKNRKVAIIASLFLAVNFIFLKESRHASFDLYSTVLLILGFYGTIIYFQRVDERQNEIRSIDLHALAPIFLAGIFFSMAATSKLFAVIPIFSLGTYMLIGIIREKRGGGHWKERSFHLLILMISTLVTTLIIMSIFGFQDTLQGMFLDNLNRPRLGFMGNAPGIFLFLLHTSIPLILSYFSMRREIKDRAVQIMLVWIVPLLIYLLLQSPVWEHYFIIVLPPICYLGARGFNLLFIERDMTDPGPERDGRGEGPSCSMPRSLYNNFRRKGPVVKTLLFLCVVYLTATTGASTTFLLVTERTIERDIAEEVSSITREDDLIISGDPIIGVYADRLQPPEATNLAVIRHPSLTDEDLIEITCYRNVSLVIFTYHLSNYDIYIRFVQRYFTFHRAYKRPDVMTDMEGEIEIGRNTFNVYKLDNGVDLSSARIEFLEELDQTPPSSQGG